MARMVIFLLVLISVLFTGMSATTASDNNGLTGIAENLADLSAETLGTLHTQLVQAIQQYQQAENNVQKFKAALSIRLVNISIGSLAENSAFNEHPIFQDIKVTLKKERTTTQDAMMYLDTITKLGEEFEANLKPEEISFIAKDNPYSLIKARGWITPFTALSGEFGKCPQTEYGQLKKKLGLRKLVETGMQVMMLANLYEDLHRSQYLENVGQLIMREKTYNKYNILKDTIYSGDLIDAAAIKASLDDARTRISEGERYLVEKGIAQKELKNYVINIARMAPNCVGTISLEFGRFLKRDLTIERGQFLLGLIREALKRSGTVPTDLSTLPLQKGDILYGSIRDGWQMEYLLQQEEQKIILKSFGEDGTESDDDIVIGQLPVESTRAP